MRPLPDPQKSVVFGLGLGWRAAAQADVPGVSFEIASRTPMTSSLFSRLFSRLLRIHVTVLQLTSCHLSHLNVFSLCNPLKPSHDHPKGKRHPEEKTEDQQQARNGTHEPPLVAMHFVFLTLILFLLSFLIFLFLLFYWSGLSRPCSTVPRLCLDNFQPLLSPGFRGYEPATRPATSETALEVGHPARRRVLRCEVGVARREGAVDVDGQLDGTVFRVAASGAKAMAAAAATTPITLFIFMLISNPPQPTGSSERTRDRLSPLRSGSERPGPGSLRRGLDGYRAHDFIDIGQAVRWSGEYLACLPSMLAARVAGELKWLSELDPAALPNTWPDRGAVERRACLSRFCYSYLARPALNSSANNDRCPQMSEFISRWFYAPLGTYRSAPVEV